MVKNTKISAWSAGQKPPKNQIASNSKNPESYKFYKIFIRSETDKSNEILQQ